MSWDSQQKQKTLGNSTNFEENRVLLEDAASEKDVEAKSDIRSKFLMGATLMAVGSVMMSGYSMPGYSDGITEHFPALKTQVGSIIAGICSGAAVATYFAKDLFDNLKTAENTLPQELVGALKDIEADAARLFQVGERGVWYVMLPDHKEPKVLSEAEMRSVRKMLDERDIPVVDIRPRRGAVKSLLMGKGPITQLVMTRTLKGKPHGDPCVSVYEVSEDYKLVEKSHGRSENGRIVPPQKATSVNAGGGLATI